MKHRIKIINIRSIRRLKKVDRKSTLRECAEIARRLNVDTDARGEYEHGVWDACNEIAEGILDLARAK